MREDGGGRAGRHAKTGTHSPPPPRTLRDGPSGRGCFALCHGPVRPSPPCWRRTCHLSRLQISCDGRGGFKTKKANLTFTQERKALPRHCEDPAKCSTVTPNTGEARASREPSGPGAERAGLLSACRAPGRPTAVAAPAKEGAPRSSARGRRGATCARPPALRTCVVPPVHGAAVVAHSIQVIDAVLGVTPQPVGPSPRGPVGRQAPAALAPLDHVRRHVQAGQGERDHVLEFHTPVPLLSREGRRV